ncbi:MAG: PilZ domain-containing protein [Kangiellaceae bacterium]
MTEKRSHARQLTNEQIHVDILRASNEKIDDKIRYEGAMKDISSNGIRLHGKHPLEKSSQLELLVEFESNHSQYQITAKVMWVTETTEKEYIAGLELDVDKTTDLESWQKRFTI